MVAYNGIFKMYLNLFFVIKWSSFSLLAIILHLKITLCLGIPVIYSENNYFVYQPYNKATHLRDF